MAKIFDVKTINKSCVTAITAGIESTANKISAFSIKIRANKLTVGSVFPFTLDKNFPDEQLIKYFA